MVLLDTRQADRGIVEQNEMGKLGLQECQMTPRSLSLCLRTSAKGLREFRTTAWQHSPRLAYRCGMVMRMRSQESSPCPDGLADLLGAYRPLHVRYAAEELICREGTFAAGLQWISQGLVLETEGGSARGQMDAPPDLLSPGDLMGIEILLPALEERHRTSCRALTEVSLLFLDRASFERAMVEDSRFSALLVRHLATRCFRLRRARARQLLGPATRLAATLLDVAPACEPVEGEESLALPEAIDARILGELSRLSPAQMRRALRELPGLRTDGGQMVFSPRDLAQDALRLREGEASECLLDDR